VKALGFEVREVMEGSLRRPGENFDRTIRFDLAVVFPALWRIFLVAVGRARGTVHVDGMARDAAAIGTLELSPFRHRLARYTFTFTAQDGQEYRFDGWKSMGWNIRRAWTTLPGRLYDTDGNVCATATIHFSFRYHFPGLLRSFRLLWPTRKEREPARPSGVHA
jgi:hypothetical protein